MGRTERELDPGAGPLERFAWGLRQLREAAGRPGYRDLAARVHFSASRLSEAAAGRAVATLAFVTVIVSVLALVSTVQARHAATARDQALSEQLAADAREQLALQPDVSLLLARKALTIRQTRAAQAALRQAVIDDRLRSVLTAPSSQVFGVTYSPDGRQIAVSGDSGTVWTWSLGPDASAHGPARALPGHRGEVWSPVFSPDGHRGGLVWQAAFSPDGRHLASSGDDGTILIWDLTAIDKAPEVLHDHRGSVWTIAYSPDGQLLASSGADGGLRIWQAPTGTLLARIHGYGSPIDQAIFGRDTHWIVTVHDDGTLRLSHCDACAPLTQIQAQANSLATRDLTL